MKILVTGAAGFLGSHLSRKYATLDGGTHEVVGIDSYVTSKPNANHNVEMRQLANFKMFEQDICVPWTDWVREVRSIQFDLIFNFACPASPPQYQASRRQLGYPLPVYTMLTCTQGVNNVLAFATYTSPHTRVVHASTSEVYGDPDVSPQAENYRGNVNPYGCRGCYDNGKRAAESLCYDYLHQYDADVRLVRIFNTYGPHMDPHDGRVVSNFITQALTGNPLTVYGDGGQRRSFCYVDDLIEGIVRVAGLVENPGGPINLGNPHEFTVKELAEHVVRKVYGGDQLSLTLSHVVQRSALPTDDPTQRCPDISRARELLDGWEPKVQLDEGLDKAITYFRAELERARTTV